MTRQKHSICRRWVFDVALNVKQDCSNTETVGGRVADPDHFNMDPAGSESATLVCGFFPHRIARVGHITAWLTYSIIYVMIQ
jgi:hypothetical protein